MLAGRWRTKEAQDGPGRCLGTHSSSRSPSGPPRAGCPDPPWDRCSLARRSLPGATAARPTWACTRGRRVHSSALARTLKRRVQVFHSILIAKTFNFQTLIFPEKCVQARNVPSVLIISKCLFLLLPQGTSDSGLEGTAQSFLHASSPKQGHLQPPGFHGALPRSYRPKVATRGPQGAQLATGVPPAPRPRGDSTRSRPGPVGTLTSPPGTPNSAPTLEGR